MKSLISFIVFCLSFASIAQTLSPDQLLENALSYHDPNQKWDTFRAQFTVETTTPNTTKRTSTIRLDLLREHFSVRSTKDTTTTVYTISKENCYLVLNNKNVDSITAKKTTCLAIEPNSIKTITPISMVCQ